MPTSFQLIGRPFAEALLFRLGHQYQRETDWHRALAHRAPGLRVAGRERSRGGMRRRAIDRAGWGRTALCTVDRLRILPARALDRADRVQEPARHPLSSTLVFTPTLDNFANIFARVHYQGGAPDRDGVRALLLQQHRDLGRERRPRAHPRHRRGLRLGFSRWAAQGNDTYLLVVLTARMLPPIVLIIPLFVIFRMTGAGRQLPRHHPAVHRVQPAVRNLDDEELLRRPAARGGGRSAYRRQLRVAGLLPRLPAPGEGRHRGDRHARASSSPGTSS